MALLTGFALQAMGRTGEPILRGVAHLQRLVFRILAMIMWVAPVGAFGAIAYVVGSTGWKALAGLLQMMLGFYVTCIIFVFVILGLLLRIVTGLNLFSVFRYLAREFLLISLIVGIDRFMSEARALTNFAGNSVATLLVGTWSGEFDKERAPHVLRGEDPFDETTMLDEDEDQEPPGSPVPPGQQGSQVSLDKEREPARV